MIIEICEDIVEAAERKESFALDVLSQLAIAHKYGKHVVYAKLVLLKRILNIISLDRFSLNMYKEICTNFTYRFTSLKPDMPRLIVTTRDEPSSYLVLNPKKRKDFELYHETLLLAENLSDIHFYDFVLMYYKREMHKKFETCYFPLNGGGDTINKVYEREISEKKHLCLTLLDSDKKMPSGANGETAKKVEKSHEDKVPFNCYYYEMNKVCEIENLIPLDVVRVCDGFSEKQIFTQDISCDLSYFDMKEGLYTKNMKPALFTYWKDLLKDTPALEKVLTENYGEADNVCIIEGFGKKLLEAVLQEPECRQRLKKISDASLSSNQKDEWLAIGKLIYDWCCSAKPKRV